MSDGQLAMNTNLVSPGLFLKDSNGDLVKVGPVHVGTTAPNATPGAGGQAGNSKGEQWLDTSSSRYVFKIWDGTAWRTEDGEFVNSSGDTMTGALVMDNQQQVRFRETTANGTNYIALQAPASVAADRTLTLPDVTGTIVSTGDTGSVTSTMILDGTILNADINASAAIVDTKLATIATAGKVSNSATTATNANTASAIVARDASGNFSAGTITAALTGNASTVTTNANLTGDVTSVGNATSIAAGVIVNADVNASAAIAGTKISPDFGSQAIATTGTLSVTGNATLGSAVICTGFEYVDLPAGTTAQRPGSPNSGMIRFNTDTNQFEGYDSASWSALGSSGASTTNNSIINGSFALAQRGTSFVAGANNDDSYNLDRWYVLSDGNDIVDITQNTATVPTNGKYAIALDVETVNKKFGIAQIIEADNCIGLIGNQVTLSFKAKVSSTTNLDNVKAAIVAWSGTADTVTSDIVSAWNVEGTNPTLVANATYENTPANLSLTTSYATYSVTATVDTASTKNIVVFIWSDVTTTSLAEFLYITDVQLEIGPVATTFERRPIGTELALCQRYYYRITGSTGERVASAYNTSTTEALALLPFPVTMRTSPSAIETTGVAGNYSVARTASTSACTVVPSYNSSTIQGVLIDLTVGSGLSTGDASQLRFAAIGAFIGVSTEL